MKPRNTCLLPRQCCVRMRMRMPLRTPATKHTQAILFHIQKQGNQRRSTKSRSYDPRLSSLCALR